ncbi:MAG TPA: hypothetical protein VFP89_10475 [Propionibacteriaceae bacterium]|nr:hypothetical protein [Propionibacteriaceae bacterium]
MSGNPSDGRTGLLGSRPLPPAEPGPPPPRPRINTFRLVAAGVVLTMLVAAVIGGVLMLNSVGTASGSTDPSQPIPSTAPTFVAAPAAKPSDVVRGYLEALAAGQADEALEFGKDQPEDRTLLTDAVLQKSLARAPITHIVVPEVKDPNADTVPATYDIGGVPVTESFSISRAGDGWQLAKTFAELDLAHAHDKTLPMKVNGAAIRKDVIRVFPGSYEFTTGSPNVDYGSDNTLLLRSPSDYPSPDGIQARLTDAGRDAFVSAAKAAVNSCLKQQKTAPADCPFGVADLNPKWIDKSTISWELEKNPWGNLQVDLDFGDPAVAEAGAPMTFVFSAEAADDSAEDYGPLKLVRYVRMAADLTEEPLKVTLRD